MGGGGASGEKAEGPELTLLVTLHLTCVCFGASRSGWIFSYVVLLFKFVVLRDCHFLGEGGWVGGWEGKTGRRERALFLWVPGSRALGRPSHTRTQAATETETASQDSHMQTLDSSMGNGTGS